MKRWVLGAALAAVLATPPSSAQDDCPPGRPTRLITGLTPVVGQSPMWVTTGTAPLVWAGANTPVQMLWVRDLAARGPAMLSGKMRAGTVKTRFARAELGFPEEQLKLDQLGIKPAASVKDADLQKYSFHRTYVWFPAAGCYEMTAKVGGKLSVIYLKMAPAKK